MALDQRFRQRVPAAHVGQIRVERGVERRHLHGAGTEHLPRCLHPAQRERIVQRREAGDPANFRFDLFAYDAGRLQTRSAVHHPVRHHAHWRRPFGKGSQGSRRIDVLPLQVRLLYAAGPRKKVQADR